jgi:hypothetical protein
MKVVFQLLQPSADVFGLATVKEVRLDSLQDGIKNCRHCKDRGIAGKTGTGKQEGKQERAKD